jgi:hypothetical protein
MAKHTKTPPVPSPAALEIPYRFEEAMDLLAELSQRSDRRGIPEQTLLAATMTTLIPRLVSLYGGSGVAAILLKLADQVTMAEDSHRATQ